MVSDQDRRRISGSLLASWSLEFFFSSPVQSLSFVTLIFHSPDLYMVSEGNQLTMYGPVWLYGPVLVTSCQNVCL
jgi:hypothetical protein